MVGVKQEGQQLNEGLLAWRQHALQALQALAVDCLETPPDGGE